MRTDCSPTARELHRWLLSALLMLLSPAIVGACGNLLGLEQRELDVAELSEGGYEGCEPGKQLCNGCTSDWHRCVCEGWNSSVEEELRAECASKAPAQIRKQQEQRWAEFLPANQPQGFDENFCNGEAPDQCVACFCKDCSKPVGSCAADPGCQELMNCVMATQCDPKQSDNCVTPDDCQRLIEEFGGPEGGTAQKFEKVLLCMAAEACPCGEGGEPLVPPQCDPGFGCSDCAGCFEQCRCGGRSVSQCENDCGTPMNGSACSPASGCDCADCHAECECNGETPGNCDFLCNENECSPGQGCNCGTCLDTCVCQGLPLPTCEAQCPGQATCNPASGCACGSCQADCVCRGGTPAACEPTCGQPTPTTITCGTTRCLSHLTPPPGQILSACCAATDRCGFDMSVMFGSEAGCAPTNEGGMSCSTCPSFPAPSPPWAPGETLQGCCRSDGLCGYSDPLLPLGCALPQHFGQGVRAKTPCTAASCLN